MKKTTIGVFEHRNDAEKFINYVHNKLSIPHDEISYVYKNESGEVKEVDSSEVSSVNTKEGAKKGATAGAIVGGIAGLAVAAGILPIIGPLLVAGPLMTALGITGGIGVTAAGAATGAAVGGLSGALVGMGIGKEKAKDYEDMVVGGDILVAIHSEKDKEILSSMLDHGAQKVETFAINI